MDMADADDGEIPPELLVCLEEAGGDFDSKLADCCRVVRAMDGWATAARAEAEFYRDKASRAEKAGERLKAYMKTEMERSGLKSRRVNDLFTVAIQSNPEAVVVDNIDAVPPEFDAVPARRLVMDAVKQAIKSGREVPGAHLHRGTHLRIR
jgi:hypothetical protein